MATTKRTKRIFISHAHADKPLVDALVDLIETGMGIPSTNIFCTALEGLGIPSGASFIDYIKQQIRRPDVVLLLITENYLKRPFCLAEMGAAWAMSHRVIPLLSGRMSPGDVGGVLGATQILKVDQDSGLNQFFQELTTALRVSISNVPRWEAKKQQFLALVGSLQPKATLPAPEKTTVSGESELPLAHHIEGIWRAEFHYTDGSEYREIIEIRRESRNEFTGRIVPSLDNCPHTASIDHNRTKRIHASLSGTDMLTGVWYQPARPLTHGAFQLKVSQEDDSLLGGWLMFSDNKGIPVSDRWNWYRHVVGANSRFGVYGVTGAGKTTLCEHLQQRVMNCRFFSESGVIGDYMKRFHEESLEEFKLRSEAGRMEGRQKAFRFHAERIKNSCGVFVGDAHYSFPAERLGSLVQPHPDSRNGIQPVMPDAAWEIYQAIIYLDTPASIVKQRLQKQAQQTGRNEWASKLGVHEIQDWIDYEKEMLSRQCALRGKPFYVLSGDGAAAEIASQASVFVEQFKPTAY
ncbi:Thymidylate kinase [Prosthecobacter debontii]|uniref:Thymidylate kinase n=1 Tax=Prosthecobacter debontii TaxID=48467 RepID=A0A1T4XL91_9BACT|nr:TIR domain-containing protein [Prosthecobacter debontii]SKA90320.1 Thymidylate kinase [Prosthecobacter debontii]